MALDYLNALGPLGGLIGGGAIPADVTPEALKRRRAVQAAIAAQKQKFPTTLGEGMTYLGEAVGERMADDRLTEAEKVHGGARQEASGGAPAAVAPPVAAPPAAAAARSCCRGSSSAPAAAPTHSTASPTRGAGAQIGKRGLERQAHCASDGRGGAARKPYGGGGSAPGEAWWPDTA